MAKTLRTIGQIASAVALVSTFVLGPINPVTLVASTVAAVASVGSQVLAKPPPARGSIARLMIAADGPQPYMMGEGPFAGVLRHDAAYGAELNGVPNPYRILVVDYSGGGPIESITPWVDLAPVTSWYSGFLYTDTQLGACPEASALTPHFAGAPGWDASSKLSGQPSILWNLKFDKKGKRFASGVPRLAAYGKWVKAYDPRLDDTFPGGVGPNRLGDETTYEWTDNPALHAGTYAYGRYQNGKRVLGVGLRSISWGVIAAWANVCEANNWTIFGPVFEGLSDAKGVRWSNLKEIAAAGGAVPILSSGGALSFKYWAPQVSLATVTAADLADAPVQYTPMQSWEDRINTIVPKYISADHEWLQVAAEAVSVAAFVTDDGEEKTQEWPFNLVKQAEQAAQLAGYILYDGREIGSISLPCLPHMRAFRPGECLTLDLPEYGLETDAIILGRALDPKTLTVTLILMGETAAKHAFALGQVAAPPAPPVPGQDAEDRDDTSATVGSSPPLVVANEAALLALEVPEGTVVKRTDNNQTYFYNGGTTGTIADWTVIATAIPNGVSAFMQTVLDDADAATARGTLGLAAVAASGSASDLTSGTLAVARGGTGVTTSTGTGNVVLSASPTFSGTITAAALTLSNTLTLTAASVQMDNNQYIYGKDNTSTATRMLGINSGNGAFVGSIDRTLVSVVISGGATWGTFTGTALNLPTGSAYRINNTQVVKARITGWATATGTPTRTTFDTATVTLPQLAERVKALIDDLHGTAGHGLIGT